MALRGFGIQTLTGTAQPVFGTQLTAAITLITPDQYTGQTDPRSRPSLSQAVVTSTQFFRPGDAVVVGPAAGPLDWAKVTKITPGTPPAGTLTLQGLTTTHLATDYVILSIPVALIRILPTVIGSTMYIGEDSTVSATSATLIYAMTTAQVTTGVNYSVMTSATANVLDTPHLWITGTSADKYLPSILLI